MIPLPNPRNALKQHLIKVKMKRIDAYLLMYFVVMVIVSIIVTA